MNIENNEWEKGRPEQSTAMKEEHGKRWVLSLPDIRPMEEPDGHINADAETMLAGRIGIEAMRGQMHI